MVFPEIPKGAELDGPPSDLAPAEVKKVIAEFRFLKLVELATCVESMV
jgi:hypothetical protein